jgi:DNA repair protein RadC
MTITYVRELTLQYRRKKGESFEVANTPGSAARFVRRILPDNVREHFVVLLLDVRLQVVGYYVAATGGASSCPVGEREVFQAAVVAGAHALVVAHNHPSGDPSPSAEDHAVTQRLKQAGELLGIRVVDHVIIGAESHYSLFEQRQL